MRRESAVRRVAAKVTSRSVRAWINSAGSDWLLAVCLVGVYEMVIVRGIRPALASNDRQVILQTLAGASGALLGLALTASTILFAVTPGPRIKRLFEQVGDQLVSSLVRSLLVLGLATAVFVVAMPLAAGDGTHLVKYPVVLAAGLVVTQVGRLIWQLSRILRAFVVQATEQEFLAEDSVQRFVAPLIDPDAHYTVSRRREPRSRPRQAKS